MPKALTVGEYLIASLEQAGLKHIFGIPGDYVLKFYDLLERSPITIIGTCTEIGAGYAADAYARIHGLGGICVTYCVGGLNALNAVAGAYAEKSPVILISGAPGLGERASSPMLHHRVRDFNTQRLIYERITVAAEALDDPIMAPRQINHAIGECLRQKRPVYIELPRDMVHMPCGRLDPPTRSSMGLTNGKSAPDVLREALDETAGMLRRAKRPMIMAGVEIHRYGLHGPLLRLVEQTGFPVVATLLGKSVIGETHPQYLGIYEGAMGLDSVRQAVERADCVLMLGVFLTDIDFGIYSSRIDVARTINACAEQIAIQRHHFDRIVLRDFIEGLVKLDLGARARVKLPRKTVPRPMKPQKGRTLTIRRFFARMNDFLKDDTVVVADVGDCLFGAAGLTIHRKTEFIGPAYYTSMGFGVPGAIGAQIGRQHVRTVVLVGDGAFQMTGQELSTIVKYKLNPIIIVINNKGYTTERFIQDGPYNDIHDWAYHRIPDVMKEGLGFEARTEDELENALTKAVKNTAGFTIINAHFAPRDCSNALDRLARRLAKQVKK